MSNAFLLLIQASTTKRVSLFTLREIFRKAHPEFAGSPERDRMLLDALNALCAEGMITLPAEGSWEKFGSPRMPKWAAIVDVSPAEKFNWITIPWVPEFGFWPELRPSQLESARCINEFLLRRRQQLRPIPIKERSLEIFGDEKRLDSLRTGDTLFGGRLLLSAIGAFQVPLPLPYRSAGVRGRPVLIVENHDSYWSFGEWNERVKCFAAVVYGSGEAFRSSGRALEQVLYETGGTSAQYLGDVDPTGISIPVDFNVSQPSTGVHITPALAFYEWLLQHGIRRAGTVTGDQAKISAWLLEPLSHEILTLFEDGFWIPQESLGIEVLDASFKL